MRENLKLLRTFSITNLTLSIVAAILLIVSLTMLSVGVATENRAAIVSGSIATTVIIAFSVLASIAAIVLVILGTIKAYNLSKMSQKYSVIFILWLILAISQVFNIMFVWIPIVGFVIGSMLSIYIIFVYIYTIIKTSRSLKEYIDFKEVEQN
ncbi:hypothetical protein MCANUFG4_02805 [Mycoplasmopsis canis UFG4]|uniref:Transmembrane protein n=1 Tax=Mycoplasmopsis canis UFG4 TaxID=1131455 RepID=I1A4G7_9BACT|nr:hypothetical protein [Mycoplasmopsis canis]AKF41413.1 hypothetical protein AAW50_03285 [Mycoplasmopsis canis]EIE39295.1 hypothetical protein MCANUF33_02800 [Mycoplasmopsis canis UF33]EIE41388.1 hypothetical protein MCANUFG4_02805 [Mycoplasmopsis canis UFG4]